MNDNTPTREDLIELGYLKPGDTLAKAPKNERKVYLNDADLEYAERNGLSNEDMKEFKKEVMIQEAILRDHRMLAANDKRETYNSPQSFYSAW